MPLHALLLPILLAAALDDAAAFQEGKRLFEELEYEQAVFRFQEAAVLPDLTDAERARALVWLGLSFGSVGDEEAARRAFADALRLDPSTTPPDVASPKLVGLFEEVARAAAPVEGPPAAAPTTSQGPAAAAPDASTPASPTDAPVPWGLVGAASSAGLGVAALASAGALGLLVAENVRVLDDQNTFQRDAKRAMDDANLQIAGATVLVGAGAALLAGAATLALLE